MIKPRKYKSEPITIDGIRFDSRKEARRFVTLQLLERGGEIRNLRRQVKIPLMGRDGPIKTPSGRQAHYVADFVYFDVRAGREVVEDSKGYRTKDYVLKRGILAAQGVKVTET